jgi:hypothetical protein
MREVAKTRNCFFSAMTSKEVDRIYKINRILLEAGLQTPVKLE